MNKLLLTAACLCTASAAQAASTINFEDYAPYPANYGTFSDSGATFTGAGGTSQFEIDAYTTWSSTGWGTSGPHVLCPYLSSNNYCGGGFTVTFDSAVTALQFFFAGDDTTAGLSVFLNGSSTSALTVNGDGHPTTAQLVDLSKFGPITSMTVSGGSLDRNGFVYDDFSWIAVPEPATWAMMLLGFGGIGLAMRRQRARAAATLG
jgi:hypothetical protein